MFDFGELANRREDPQPLAPLDLYETLDRETTHYTLRPEQRSAVQRLWDTRDQRDAVLKMATGAGKTIVALLHLYSVGLSSRKPVVYLCPTRQLVEQVLGEARRAGIPAHCYQKGERQPHPDCLQGRAVLVCTYSKLFNAQTSFDREEVQLTPHCVVLDDAHTGVDYIRSAFIVRIAANDEQLVGLFNSLMQLVRSAAAQYNAPEWHDIEQGDPRALIELPYWSWNRIADDAARLIAPFGNPRQPLALVWPFVRDGIEKCRCLIATHAIEITPVLPLVERVRAYDAAEHRIFMSATLLDDSMLVRELAAAKEAVTAPIEVGSGTGERMIVAPSLVSPMLTREWVIEWAKSLATWKRVVVLCASAKQASDWERAGAELAMGDDAARLADKLRHGRTNFAAFVQRYDGVDLPDEACRVLIFDGLPTGENLVDRQDAGTALIPGGARNRLVHRIEQGMGRAVRSPADYAAVILAGRELATFVSRREIQEQFTEYTQREMKLADFLAREARQRQTVEFPALLQDMVSKCLQRDAGWKALYEQKVRQALRARANVVTPEKALQAEAERASVRHLWLGDSQRAVVALDPAINASSGEEKGRLLQEQARVKYATDPDGALAVQKAARDLSKRLLLPPEGTRRRVRTGVQLSAAKTLLRWIHGEQNANAAVLHAAHVRDWLHLNAGHKQLEQALAEMSPFLGAEGEQAERTYGEGAPDDLVQWTEKSLVIEAKQGDSPHIIKADAEQLHHSVQWFNDTFPGRSCVPVLVTRTNIVGEGVHLPDGSRVIMEPQLQAISRAIEGLASKIAEKPPLEWTEAGVAALLVSYKLGPDSFVGTFTVAPT